MEGPSHREERGSRTLGDREGPHTVKSMDLESLPLGESPPSCTNTTGRMSHRRKHSMLEKREGRKRLVRLERGRQVCGVGEKKLGFLYYIL